MPHARSPITRALLPAAGAITTTLGLPAEIQAIVALQIEVAVAAAVAKTMAAMLAITPQVQPAAAPLGMLM